MRVPWQNVAMLLSYDSSLAELPAFSFNSSTVQRKYPTLIVPIMHTDPLPFQGNQHYTEHRKGGEIIDQRNEMHE